MTKAIRIHANGGPEVLAYEDIEVGRPGKGEALIRHTAIGVNFIDIYYRSGLYPPPAGLPLIPGSEAAGVVIETGEGVDIVKPGDRVAYAGPLGAYAERAGDRGRPAGENSRRHFRRAGGRDDAERHDGRLSAAAHLSGETRGHRTLPCGGRRRRTAVRPMGQASRGHGHRHRGLARQDRARQGAWLRPRHQLPRQRFRRGA